MDARLVPRLRVPSREEQHEERECSHGSFIRRVGVNYDFTSHGANNAIYPVQRTPRRSIMPDSIDR